MQHGGEPTPCYASVLIRNRRVFRRRSRAAPIPFLNFAAPLSMQPPPMHAPSSRKSRISRRIAPYFAHPDKGVIVLCRTSNEGGAEVQLQRAGNAYIYQIIAQRAVKQWN